MVYILSPKKGEHVEAMKIGNNPNELLTIEEVAEILRCSPRTIYNRVRPGAKKKFPIKARRVAGGRLIRFLRKDVDDHIGGK